VATARAVALPLRDASQPTLAPLTALLVVQVSLSQTQRSAPGGCRGYRNDASAHDRLESGLERHLLPLGLAR
jgi:hypothetical protein